MITYTLTISKTFPKSHPRAGQKTYFKEKMEIAHVVPYNPNGDIIPDHQPQMKLHTIRANYKLWKKRFKKINEGKACLSIRQWSGKPYASKQVEIAKLTREDGIGLQMLTFDNNDIESFNLPEINDENTVTLEDIATNDGLNFFDWVDWFIGYDLDEPMAIIHFTKFRYRY